MLIGLVMQRDDLPPENAAAPEVEEARPLPGGSGADVSITTAD